MTPKKPEPSPAAIIESTAPPIAEPPVPEQELQEGIARDEAALRQLEQQHGEAVTLAAAEPLEREIGVVQGRLRRTRGHLLHVQRQRVRAEAAARAAVQQPHRDRLRQLADDEVPAAAEAYQRALKALVETGTALVAAFTAARHEAAAAGHPRAAEVGPDDPAAFTAFLGVGALYTVSPRVVETRRLWPAAALARAVVGLQQLVHQEPDADE